MVPARRAWAPGSGPLRIGRLQVALGVALSAVCLWVAFRHVGFVDLGANLRAADYRWLIFYPVLATALNLVRSEIWRFLLGNRVGRAEAFWAYGVGFFVNNVMPLRIGEATRIALLARRSRIPIVEVAAAVALERLLDVVCVLAILAATLPLVVGSLEIRQTIVVVATTAGLGAGMIAFVILMGDRLTGTISAVLTATLPKYAPLLLRRWRELNAGLSVMRRPAVAFRAMSLALLVWVLTIVLQWTVLRALQPAAGLLDASLLVGMVSMAGAVPAAPGAIGTYQWVAQQALFLPFPSLYTPGRALAAAIVSHAATYVFSSGLGVIGLWYFGVSLAKVRRIDTDGPEPAVMRTAL